MYDKTIYRKYLRDDPQIPVTKKWLCKMIATTPVTVFRGLLYAYLNLTRIRGYKLMLNEMKHS